MYARLKINQTIYEQLKFILKILFIFICLVNKPSLRLNIKQAKLKYNNIFVNNHDQFNYI